jgi:hypothetical protein
MRGQRSTFRRSAERKRGKHPHGIPVLKADR